jgi:hypothetical protein
LLSSEAQVDDKVISVAAARVSSLLRIKPQRRLGGNDVQNHDMPSGESGDGRLIIEEAPKLGQSDQCQSVEGSVVGFNCPRFKHERFQSSGMINLGRCEQKGSDLLGFTNPSRAASGEQYVPKVGYLLVSPPWWLLYMDDLAEKNLESADLVDCAQKLRVYVVAIGNLTQLSFWIGFMSTIMMNLLVAGRSRGRTAVMNWRFNEQHQASTCSLARAVLVWLTCRSSAAAEALCARSWDHHSRPSVTA